MSIPLILASSSQIRQDILTGAGLNFTVQTSKVDEATIKTSMLADKAKPRDIADALAEAKALKVSRMQTGLVIGADQVMVMDGILYDKPKDMDEARQRLWSMRGKSHQLIGAIVVCDNGQAIWRHIAKTTLHMREFSEGFLDDYLEKEGEGLLSSVGAYKFEGRGSQLFTHVDGNFFSILGLSLLPLLDYLRQRGAIKS